MSRGKVNANERADAMRAFMTSMAPPVTRGDWKLIGRELYRRGAYGTFKLEIDSGGTHQAIAGLRGTYTSDAGATSRVELMFVDLLVSTNPTNNPNYSGESCCANESTWDWHIAKPKDLTPLHVAIMAWFAIWNARA